MTVFSKMFYVTVTSTNANTTVTFIQDSYILSFTESGLPSGTS